MHIVYLYRLRGIFSAPKPVRYCDQHPYNFIVLLLGDLEEANKTIKKLGTEFLIAPNFSTNSFSFGIIDNLENLKRSAILFLIKKVCLFDCCNLFELLKWIFG